MPGPTTYTQSKKRWKHNRFHSLNEWRKDSLLKAHWEADLKTVTDTPW